MTDSSPPPKRDNFLFPYARFHGEFTPENLAFDANLQEFAQRIAYICALENSGKIPPAQAYLQIKQLWESLSASRDNLLNQDSDTEA